MSDVDFKGTNSNQGQNARFQDLKDQVTDAGAEMKQRAGDALRASTEVARDKFKEATETAKDVASGTVDRLQDKAREQQHTGADFIDRLAGNIREAARAFDNDAPFAARGINSAADYVEDTAEKLRNGSFQDLVAGATDFARRQPAAFLGLSVLAGFAAIRFLKASGNSSTSSSSFTSGGGSKQDPTWAGSPSASGIDGAG